MIFSPAHRRAASRTRLTGRWGLALAVLPVALAGCGDHADAPPIKVDGSAPSLHGTRLARPFHEPDLTLTGTSGRPVNLKKATHGKLTLVYFGYTHCPDVCPTTMADLAAARRRLPPAQRSRIAVVFVTTDPWRDTPKVIKSWLAAFDPSFIGLTGDYAKIRTAARSLGIPLDRPKSTTGDYEVTHGAEVLPFGTDQLAHFVYTAGVSSQGWAADLPKLLREMPATGASGGA